MNRVEPFSWFFFQDFKHSLNLMVDTPEEIRAMRTPSGFGDAYDTANNMTTDAEADRSPSHIDGVFQLRGSKLSLIRTSGASRAMSKQASRRMTRHSGEGHPRSRDSQMLRGSVHSDRQQYDDDERRPTLRRNSFELPSRSRSRTRFGNRSHSSQRNRRIPASELSDETSPRARHESLEFPSRHNRSPSTPEDLWRVVEPTQQRNSYSQRRPSQRR